MNLAHPRFTLRRVMALVCFVAVDCAAFHNGIWHGSHRWLLVFLLLTVVVPLLVGFGKLLWWVVRSRVTLL